MTATLDAAIPASAAGFGRRLAPVGDPLEGEAFEQVYEAKIKPELVKCEAQRQGALQTFLLSLVAGAVLVYIEYLMTPSLTHGASTMPDLRIVMITLVIAAALGYLPLAAVARRAKLSVIQALCEPLGVDYQLKQPNSPDLNQFLGLRLLPHPDDSSFQDFFSGRRGDVAFALCEAVLTQGSGKNRTTVFHGQIFTLSTPRRLGSTTVLLRNTGWFKSFECPQGLKAVGLEDPTFNKSFAVFGTDQVEARELLTPAFMQELNDLETAYRGAHIRCGFDHTQLLIALEGPNRFEIGSMFTTLVDRSRVEGIARNIDQVFKLIDEFRGA